MFNFPPNLLSWLVRISTYLGEGVFILDIRRIFISAMIGSLRSSWCELLGEMFILKWVGSHERIIIFRKPLLLPQTCIYATHFKAALRNSFTKLEDCERVWIVEIIRSNYALWALSSEPENTDQPTAALYNGPAPHHRIEDRRLEGIHMIIKLMPR